MSLTILDEQPLVLRPCVRAHVNLDVLNTGGLSDWPMDASSCGSRRDSSHIQNEVSQLLEEQVCRSPSLVTVTLVLITVDEAESGEPWGSLYDWERVRIANNVSKIVVDNGCGDDISPGWEIDNSRSGR